MVKRALFFFLFFSFPLFALYETEEKGPNFAGSLLGIPSTTVGPEHFLVQPFFIYSRDYSSYGDFVPDSNPKTQETFILDLQTGLSPTVDVIGIFNITATQSHFGNVVSAGDTLVVFGFQLQKEKKNSLQPNIKLMLGENFPTGKFEELDLEGNGIEAGGGGSFDTWLGLSIGKVIALAHPFQWTVNLLMINPSPVSVHGLSVYGGDSTTRGRVVPGRTYIVNLGFEYMFREPNWAWGLDFHWDYTNSSPFTGHSQTPVGLPSSGTFSIAPCLEYMYDEHWGGNLGVWFSVTGKNSDAFVNGVLTVYYYY